MQTLAATDENNEDGENEPLDQGHADVAGVGEFLDIHHKINGLDVEDVDGDEIRSDHSATDAFNDQQRHGNQHGHCAGNHEVVDRIDGQGAEGVNLLGD